MDEPIREAFLQISVSDDDRAIIMAALRKATRFASNFKTNSDYAFRIALYITILPVSSTKLYCKLFDLIVYIHTLKWSVSQTITDFEKLHYPWNLPTGFIKFCVYQFIYAISDPDDRAYAERMICLDPLSLRISNIKGALRE